MESATTSETAEDGAPARRGKSANQGDLLVFARFYGAEEIRIPDSQIRRKLVTVAGFEPATPLVTIEVNAPPVVPFEFDPPILVVEH